MSLFEEAMVQHFKHFSSFPWETASSFNIYYGTFFLKAFSEAFLWSFHFSKWLRDWDFRVRISIHPWLERSPGASWFGCCALNLDRSPWTCPVLYRTLWWRRQKSCPSIQAWGLKIAFPLFSSVNWMKSVKDETRFVIWYVLLKNANIQRFNHWHASLNIRWWF